MKICNKLSLSAYRTKDIKMTHNIKIRSLLTRSRELVWNRSRSPTGQFGISDGGCFSSLVVDAEMITNKQD